MPYRTRRLDEARRRWRAQLRQAGQDLRAARHVAAATQVAVAAVVGVSQSEVSRRELGQSQGVRFEDLAMHAAAVGMRLSLSLWPVGGQLRDAAQARYINRLVARIGRAWNVILEASMPKAGDLRAIDVVLRSGQLRIAVEVITRLADLQAQVRAAQLKARDYGADRLVIVVAGTHANRRAMDAARETLRASFDLDAQRVLADLAHGRDPGRDAFILLS